MEMEIIVSDNASTDDTEDVVRSINDDRIRYFRNIENLGMVENFRRAINRAKGKYVTLLCSDDLLYPGALKQLVEILEDDPDAVLVFSQVDFIGERQGGTKHRLPATMSGQEFVNRSLSSARNFVHLCTGTFRREIGQAIPIEDLLFFDWTFWLDLGLKGKVRFVDQLLGAHRYHHGNETKNVVTCIAAEYQNLDRSLERFGSGLSGKDATLLRRIECARSKLFLRYAGLLYRQMGGGLRGLAQVRCELNSPQTSILVNMTFYGIPLYQYGLRKAMLSKRLLQGSRCAS